MGYSCHTMKRLVWVADIEQSGTEFDRYRLGEAPPMCVLAVIAAICDAAHDDGFTFASVGRLVGETGVRADVVEVIIAELEAVGLVNSRYNARGMRLLEPNASLRPIYRLLGVLGEDATGADRNKAA